jgi:EVE domain
MQEPKQAFVCVISPKSVSNWEVCRRLGMWGFTTAAHRKFARLVRAGDYLWFYVSGKGFVALAQADSLPQPFAIPGDIPWKDGREYASFVKVTFIAEVSPYIRPKFPSGFGGYKFDPELRIGSNQLLSGFFQIDEVQHKLLLQDSGVSLATQRPTLLPIPSPPQLAPASEEREHTRAQWQLARMGRALGLDIWIPRADRQKSYQGERLGELSVSTLPSFGLGQAENVVENIDVLWIDAGVISCAFEVEHTTNVHSGLLRLSDLVTVQPYTSIRLFIVAPNARRDKVKRELARPTFARARPPLSELCRFLSYERLEERLRFAVEHGRYLRPDWADSLADSSHASTAAK